MRSRPATVNVRGTLRDLNSEFSSSLLLGLFLQKYKLQRVWMSVCVCVCVCVHVCQYWCNSKVQS